MYVVSAVYHQPTVSLCHFTCQPQLQHGLLQCECTIAIFNYNSIRAMYHPTMSELPYCAVYKNGSSEVWLLLTGVLGPNVRPYSILYCSIVQMQTLHHHLTYIHVRISYIIIIVIIMGILPIGCRPYRFVVQKKMALAFVLSSLLFTATVLCRRIPLLISSNHLYVIGQ